MVEGLHEILEMIEKRFPRWVGTGLLGLIMLAIASAAIHFIFTFAIAPVFALTGTGLKPLIDMLEKPVPYPVIMLFGAPVRFMLQAIVAFLVLIGILLLCGMVVSLFWRSGLNLWHYEKDFRLWSEWKNKQRALDSPDVEKPGHN